jgi:hypothetical protein
MSWVDSLFLIHLYGWCHGVGDSFAEFKINGFLGRTSWIAIAHSKNTSAFQTFSAAVTLKKLCLNLEPLSFSAWTGEREARKVRIFLDFI